MNDRPALQRALLRRVLRKQIHQDQTTKKQIELVLDDGPLFETTYETVMELATEFGRATGIFSVSINSTGQPVASNLFKLLQWFLANGPELVKIIEQVMDLFGSVSVTAHLVAQECQHGV